jgi:hypothetical protein
MILQMGDKLYNKIRLHFLHYFFLEGILFEKNSIYFMKFIQLIYPNFPWIQNKRTEYERQRNREGNKREGGMEEKSLVNKIGRGVEGKGDKEVLRISLWIAHRQEL